MDRELRVPRDNETVLGGGVYALLPSDPVMQTSFPHQPVDYLFPPYRLTSTFGKGEAEEVAARYITLCREVGVWSAIDYNVFRRMVGAELRDQQIQTGQVFSFISAEMARYGTKPEDWIAWVIDAGCFWLIDGGWIDAEYAVDEDGSPCTIITPTDQFFERIEPYALAPVTG